MICFVSGNDFEKDKFFMKNVKYYCKGRGCRHKGSPECRPTAVCFYMKVIKHKFKKKRHIKGAFNEIHVHVTLVCGKVKLRFFFKGLAVQWYVT